MQGYSIEIVTYDPSWPRVYEEEKSRLQSVIGAKVLRFEHMGSTSVPGLDSKPIIDISAAVGELSAVSSLFPILKELGYNPIELDVNDRIDLWKQSGDSPPTHILHFMEDKSGAWMRPLVFRNALRGDVSLREEYAALKRKLAEDCGRDIRRYGKGKTQFIYRVVNEYLSQSAQ